MSNGQQIAYLAFTKQGEALALKIRDALGGTVSSAAEGVTLDAFTQNAFESRTAIVFVGALGIAVRAIAPYLTDKTRDPAVVVIDEKARHVIPVVSGHLGGANALARRIAQVTGAEAVITTATDVNGVFAVDEWARVQGFVVRNPERIKRVSAKCLRGEEIMVHSLFPVAGKAPEGVRLTDKPDTDVTLGVHTDTAGLSLIAPVLVLGCGTRKGIAREVIEAQYRLFLEETRVAPEAVCGVASIDIKASEAGLLAFCEAHGWELETFGAFALSGVQGDFTPSPFVEETTGVDNVCERSAVLASGGTLFAKKFAASGVTFALAAKPFQADWRYTDG